MPFVKSPLARAATGALVGCVCLFNASATPVGYTPEPFTRYQPILDRMPFGALPPNFGQVVEAAPTVTDAQVQAEQQKLAKQINMSCINVTPEGTTAIGFTDLGAKPPASYYLLVGATAGGWTVANADYDEEWAQIEKDGVTITLKLGKGLIDAPPAPAKALAAPGAPPAPLPAPAAAIAAPPHAGSIIRRPSTTGTSPVPAAVAAQMAEMQKTRDEIAKIKETGGDVKSYIERLRDRRLQESEAKAAAEQGARDKLQELARKITRDELAKKEREMNLSLIEQGAKPISDIELTPEEDQALVDKGVLTQ